MYSVAKEFCAIATTRTGSRCDACIPRGMMNASEDRLDAVSVAGRISSASGVGVRGYSSLSEYRWYRGDTTTVVLNAFFRANHGAFFFCRAPCDMMCPTPRYCCAPMSHVDVGAFFREPPEDVAGPSGSGFAFCASAVYHEPVLTIRRSSSGTLWWPFPAVRGFLVSAVGVCPGPGRKT